MKNIFKACVVSLALFIFIFQNSYAIESPKYLEYLDKSEPVKPYSSTDIALEKEKIENDPQDKDSNPEQDRTKDYSFFISLASTIGTLALFALGMLLLKKIHTNKFKTHQHIERRARFRISFLVIAATLILTVVYSFYRPLDMISALILVFLVPWLLYKIIISGYRTNIHKEVQKTQTSSITQTEEEYINTEQSNPPLFKDKFYLDKKFLIGFVIIILSIISSLFIVIHQSPEQCVSEKFYKIKKDIKLIDLETPLFDIKNNKQVTSAIVTTIESNKDIKTSSSRFKEYVALRAILDECNISYKK